MYLSPLKPDPNRPPDDALEAGLAAALALAALITAGLFIALAWAGPAITALIISAALTYRTRQLTRNAGR